MGPISANVADTALGVFCYPISGRHEGGHIVARSGNRDGKFIQSSMLKQIIAQMYLFLEWILSPPGLKKWEEITSYGAPFPGMETRQAKLVENLTLAVRTEEVELKTLELGLAERFGKILGIVH